MNIEFTAPANAQAIAIRIDRSYCGDACPIYPGKRYEDWVLDDPAGQDLETVRRIRDDLDQRVTRLVEELAPS